MRFVESENRLLTHPESSRSQRTAHSLGWVLLAIWTGVILLAVVPWLRLQDHAHWDRIGWIPFSGRASSPPRDILLNVLLYVPFGYLLARQVRQPTLWWTLGCACALSVATELVQVFSHGRFPSSTDVVSNVLGAASGALAALMRRANR